MAYFIGAGLALAVSFVARFVGFDRDRAFSPTVMLVIASCHGLFAVMGGSPQALARESVGVVGFIVLAILGFKLDLRWAVAVPVGVGACIAPSPISSADRPPFAPPRHHNPVSRGAIRQDSDFGSRLLTQPHGARESAVRQSINNFRGEAVHSDAVQ